jgi:signal transduction histidine kinase
MTTRSPAARVIPVLTMTVLNESDIVAARHRARQLASLAGFSNQDQVRIATAVSEIARNAHQYGGGGRVEFGIGPAGHARTLSIRVTDNGPGIPDLDSALSGRHPSAGALGLGLMSSRRLMDTFEIHSAPGHGTVVECSKALPPEASALESRDIAAIAARLTQESVGAASEVQVQGRDLLETLEALSVRERELEKRQAEIRRITAELEETNRGVVALYAELDEKAVALRHADELKGRFLRHVSHEFRTPLNSIVALTGLLARGTDGDLTAEQERQVGFIRQAALDLTEMVNDLLDLAKVEAGKTELHITPVDLARLFGALRGIMRPIVASDAVTLVIEEPGEPFIFKSDESKIGQILRNLVSNALKFTERGEVRVRSRISGPWLEISVIDSGIGIAPENQDRIFQEFAQIDSPIQGRVKGTGLGLPLSRKLATLLGGELTVESKLGEGSRFTLKLPVAEMHGKRDEDVRPLPDSILIVDDDEMARYLVRHRLRGTRHRIIEASGGVEGAERARFERPALILLDVVMPDRNGFDVIEELKSDPATREIPVIIHTSLGLNELDFERLGQRHAAILRKGEDWPPELREYIKRLLSEPGLFAGEPVPE